MGRWYWKAEDEIARAPRRSRNFQISVCFRVVARSACCDWFASATASRGAGDRGREIVHGLSGLIVQFQNVVSQLGLGLKLSEHFCSLQEGDHFLTGHLQFRVFRKSIEGLLHARAETLQRGLQFTQILAR